MTIPEPTEYQSQIRLDKWYDVLQNNGEIGVSGQDLLLRRAYHAERERDQLRLEMEEHKRYSESLQSAAIKLRARVAELEAVKEVAGE